MQAGASTRCWCSAPTRSTTRRRDLPFADALARVPLSAHAGLLRRRDRGALRLAPAAVARLRAVGRRAARTTAARRCMQPAIAPLYDSRSAHELLALLAADDDARRPRAACSATGARRRGASGFDAFWRASLRAGVVAGSGRAGAAPADSAALPAPPRAAGAGRRRARCALFVADAVGRATARSPTTAGCRSCRGRSPS